MKRPGKYEKRAKIYAAYISAVRGIRHHFLVRHKTPLWSSYEGPGQEWAVYFRSEKDRKGHARMTGHDIEKDLAYKMIFDFYMKLENMNWPELEIKAAAVGVDI